MQQTIYVVGKSYPSVEAVNQIHHLGYKAGIFLDSEISSKLLDAYDEVIPLNFAATDTFAAQLANAPNLAVAGLLCVHENYLIAKSVLADLLQLPALSAESARLCTDKLLMRQAFSAYDPTITPQARAVQSQTDALAFADTYGYPLIIKPTNLVKSLLVLRCNNRADLVTNLQFAQANVARLYAAQRIYNRQPQLIIEEFIDGTSCSVAAFVDAKGQAHFCDGVTAITTAADMSVNDSYLYARQLPAQLDATTTATIFAVASKGIAALHMTSSPAHVELIYNDRGAKIVEIGARTGGYRNRMYQYAYGTSLIEQEIRLALGQTPQPPQHNSSYCGVFELFPAKEGAFIAIGGALNNADNADHTNYAKYSVKAKPGQMIGPAKAGYGAAAVIKVNEVDYPTYVHKAASIAALTVEVNSA